jgi:hypothetical protein
MTDYVTENNDPASYGTLDPDLVLPEQFFAEQAPNWSGELSLLWTVFSDGIETFRKEVLLGRERSEAFLETVAWMELTNDDSIFSFERLCELFKVNATNARRTLREWRERQHVAPTAARAA